MGECLGFCWAAMEKDITCREWPVMGTSDQRAGSVWSDAAEEAESGWEPGAHGKGRARGSGFHPGLRGAYWSRDGQALLCLWERGSEPGG